jgi:hypothetical protein
LPIANDFFPFGIVDGRVRCGDIDPEESRARILPDAKAQPVKTTKAMLRPYVPLFGRPAIPDCGLRITRAISS